MRRTLLLILFSALVVAGCSQQPVPTAPGAGSGDGAWVGLLGDSVFAPAVLLLHSAGGTVTGDLVTAGPAHYLLNGAVSHDTTWLAIGGGGRVAVTHRGDSLYARFARDTMLRTFAGRAVPLKPFVAIEQHAYAYTATGAGRGGGSLWLATDDSAYIKVNGDHVEGALQLTLAGRKWAGPVMAWQVDRMWATTAVAVVDSTGFALGADLHGWNALGRTTDYMQLLYEPTGLAWDGAALWALHPRLPQLFKLGTDGHTTATVTVEAPDARLLAWYAGRFWTVEWTIRKLCALDTSGRIVAIYALPADTTPTPLALTSDGSKLEYVEGVVGTTWAYVPRVP